MAPAGPVIGIVVIDMDRGLWQHGPEVTNDRGNIHLFVVAGDQGGDAWNFCRVSP